MVLQHSGEGDAACTSRGAMRSQQSEHKRADHVRIDDGPAVARLMCTLGWCDPWMHTGHYCAGTCSTPGSSSRTAAAEKHSLQQAHDGLHCRMRPHEVVGARQAARQGEIRAHSDSSAGPLRPRPPPALCLLALAGRAWRQDALSVQQSLACAQAASLPALSHTPPELRKTSLMQSTRH